MKRNEVEEWVNVIKIATDPGSPFRGMVDLNGIFKVALPVQQEIFNRLTVEQRDSLKELYGPKA